MVNIVARTEKHVVTEVNRICIMKLIVWCVRETVTVIAVGCNLTGDINWRQHAL
jgi:hypothetical protein